MDGLSFNTLCSDVPATLMCSSDALTLLQENTADKLGDVLHKVGDAAKNVKHKK